MKETMKQTIALCYLATGGGHSSGASSLKEKISSQYPHAKCVMYNPFEKRAFFSSLFFEKGYSITSNYLGLLYLLFYRITSHITVLNFGRFIYRNFFLRRFTNFLKREKITKVVCLHELLIPHMREAIDIVDPSISLITIVMDPFTCHPIWFYERRTHLIVFSEKIRKEAIEKYKFDESRVHTFPVMLSEKFNSPCSMEEKQKVKDDLGIAKDDKVVLIAGGGEGLKNATRLLFFFLRRRFKGHVIVVCGKNKKLKRMLHLIVKHYQAKNVTIFGFVSSMPELMNIADCIISKSGPATIMEALSIGKPLILSSYVRGQEFGNKCYVEMHNVGWYIPNSLAAVKKAEEIVNGNTEKIKENITKLNIQNGLQEIAHFIIKHKIQAKTTHKQH